MRRNDSATAFVMSWVSMDFPTIFFKSYSMSFRKYVVSAYAQYGFL